jgi:hypothetical protein
MQSYIDWLNGKRYALPLTGALSVASNAANGTSCGFVALDPQIPTAMTTDGTGGAVAFNSATGEVTVVDRTKLVAGNPSLTFTQSGANVINGPVNTTLTLAVQNVVSTKSILLSTVGAGSWTLPADADVTKPLRVEAIGAGVGGSRGADGGTSAGTGGASGAYAQSSLDISALTPGTSSLFYNIAAGGLGATTSGGGNGNPASDTWFNKAANSAPTLASNGVLAKSGAGTGGGSNTSSVGTITTVGSNTVAAPAAGLGSGGNAGSAGTGLSATGNAGRGGQGFGTAGAGGGGGGGGVYGVGSNASTIGGAAGGPGYSEAVGGSGGTGTDGASGSNGSGGGGGAGNNVNGATAFNGGAGGAGAERFIGSFNGTNGLNNASWTLGSGVSNSSGTLTCTSAAQLFSQSGILTVGNRYRLEMDFTRTAGNRLRLVTAFGGAIIGAQSVNRSSGTLSFDFIATSTTLAIEADTGAFSGTVSNVTLIPCTNFVQAVGPGGGGGAGGGSNNTGATGGRGGNGALYGAGGGGGGSAPTSGNGGDGAQGCIVITYATVP